ncbi:MAG: hypothetical protein ACC651_07425 [Candidatus Scalindua sp.]
MTTILLVEDDKNQCLLYEQELRLEGYEVITAIDGKDALEKVQEQSSDLSESKNKIKELLASEVLVK